MQGHIELIMLLLFYHLNHGICLSLISVEIHRYGFVDTGKVV